MAPRASADFDLAVTGGRLVDSEAGTVTSADVGIRAGRIAAIEEDIDAADAQSTIDATGDYITPGLVDLHAHVNWRTAPAAIHADPYAARSGVTTWVDAGSANATTVEALREYVISTSKVYLLRWPRSTFLLMAACRWSTRKTRKIRLRIFVSAWKSPARQLRKFLVKQCQKNNFGSLQ